MGSPKVANPKEFKTTQVRIKSPAVLAEGTGGTITWMTPTRAQFLRDKGAIEVIGERELVTAAQQSALEKKTEESSTERQTGPTTDSPSSSQSGTEDEQSYSVGDLQSTKQPAPSSARRGRRDRSQES